MKKKLLLLSLLFFNKINLAPDPLSKIEITSDKAVCRKDKDSKNNFTFKYIDNVNVTFADESTIKSQELEVEIDTTKTDTNSNVNDKTSVIKKITFKNRVNLVNQNKIVNADFAELYPEQKLCKLEGNVTIEQKKVTPKDLPIQTKCQQAILNMETEEITLQGSAQAPVSTVIELAGKQGLLKKVKTKEEKRADRLFLSKQKRLNNKNEHE